MSYHSRSNRRYARKSKRSFLVTLIIIIALIFITLNWIIPGLISSLGFLNKFKSSEVQKTIPDDASLAPPVLNIPYEATNSAQIEIKGYATLNSKVRIFIDDDLKSEVEVESDGSFIAQNVNLNLGTNTIYGKTISLNSKESLPSKRIKLLFDDEKPTLELSEPEDGKVVTGDKRIKFVGTTNQDTQVFINNFQVVVNSEGIFETTLSLNDGDNNFTIIARDRAANTTELTRKITYQ